MRLSFATFENCTVDLDVVQLHAQNHEDQQCMEEGYQTIKHENDLVSWLRENFSEQADSLSCESSEHVGHVDNCTR